MDENKIKVIFSDEAFVTSLLSLETAQQVQAAVQGRGLVLSIEEIETIKQRLAEGNAELTAEELDSVAGGCVLTTIAVISGILGVAAGVAGFVGSTACLVDIFTRRRW